MHGSMQCSTGKQIDSGCLELASTGSKEGKIELARLDMTMHFIEEIGQALDFIDDYPTAGFRSLHIQGKEGWIGEMVLIAGLIEEIDVQCIGKLPSSPGTLADST